MVFVLRISLDLVVASSEVLNDCDRRDRIIRDIINLIGSRAADSRTISGSSCIDCFNKGLVFSLTQDDRHATECDGSDSGCSARISD